MIAKNENKSICGSCGGQCCKISACMVSPDDIEITYKSIKQLFKDGYCFDYWEGDIESVDKYDQIYYLRPQHKNRIGDLIDASWGGECLFLTDKGCKLNWSQRPAQGKALKPNLNNSKCELPEKYSKETLIKEWRKHQIPLTEILNKLYDET